MAAPSQEMVAVGASKETSLGDEGVEVEYGNSLKIHYRNDLMTDAQIAEKKRLAQYPLGIDYNDWGKICGLFTVFYLLLTSLFALASAANYAAETNEACITYACMMGATWFGIIVAINLGRKAREEAEAEKLAGIQTMASSEQC
mmetsp:Transcript_9110/g.21422  ORF Transcript_9110/g.21422 Transcript_9110/m.21422 type:complete len:144 (+) Transcript_9110:63-494(+)